MNNYKYVIVSPVRNEEQFIERTMESVIAQTIIPTEWIIMNDGSSDRTASIISKYTAKYSWIKSFKLSDRGYYGAGAGVVEVFNKGLNELDTKDWQFVVKMDGDISFGSDYFEGIFNKFGENKKLGIASGCTYSIYNNKLIRDNVQNDCPLGASKIYRRKCFEDIGGLKSIPGWDLADILVAQIRGWETRCFSEYRIIHYRRIGARRKGITGGKYYLGVTHYRIGYSFSYTLLKAIYKLLDHPYFIGGIAIIAGYICSFLKRDKKYLDEETINYLRNKHRNYLFAKFKLWVK